MTELNFTPGPWYKSDTPVFIGDGVFMWGLVPNRIALLTMNEADAELAAAAPELYSELKIIVERTESIIRSEYEGCELYERELSLLNNAKTLLKRIEEVGK